MNKISIKNKLSFFKENLKLKKFLNSFELIESLYYLKDKMSISI